MEPGRAPGDALGDTVEALEKMTSNLNAHRLFKAYQSLAAEDYASAPQAFSGLADLAASCLSNVTAEQRLPAMVLQNVFDRLSQDEDLRAETPEAPRPVSPELHEALMTAIKFVATGGSPARCIQVSDRLIKAAAMGEPDGA